MPVYNFRLRASHSKPRNDFRLAKPVAGVTCKRFAAAVTLGLAAAQSRSDLILRGDVGASRSAIVVAIGIPSYCSGEKNCFYTHHGFSEGHVFGLAFDDVGQPQTPQSQKIATARVQPAEARCTFTGKQTMSNPCDGSEARLPSFSI